MTGTCDNEVKRSDVDVMIGMKEEKDKQSMKKEIVVEVMQ